jgi:DNA-binding response OmpR family regulator
MKTEEQEIDEDLILGAVDYLHSGAPLNVIEATLRAAIENSMKGESAATQDRVRSDLNGLMREIWRQAIDVVLPPKEGL